MRRTTFLPLLVAIVVCANPALAQQLDTGMRLELVMPDTAKPAHAPVSLLVWRLNVVPPDTLVWSVRAGNADLSRLVVWQGREMFVTLPPESALGHGSHRLVADVCVPHGPCATSEVTLVVAAPEVRRPDSDDIVALLLRLLVELLRQVLPIL